MAVKIEIFGDLESVWMRDVLRLYEQVMKKFFS
jgi:hypothetical protein